jgi:hypothetical protein
MEKSLESERLVGGTGRRPGQHEVNNELSHRATRC